MTDKQRLNGVCKRVHVLSDGLKEIKQDIDELKHEEEKKLFRVLGGENHTEEQTLKTAEILMRNTTEEYYGISTSNYGTPIVYFSSYTRLAKLKGVQTVKFPLLHVMLQLIAKNVGSFVFSPRKGETVYMTIARLYADVR